MSSNGSASDSGVPDAASEQVDSAARNPYSSRDSPAADIPPAEEAMSQDASSEWLTIEQLATGSEQIGGMLVRSAQIRAILHGVEKLGARRPPILIMGEPGVGKKMLARALHATSFQSRGAFVRFSCEEGCESRAALKLFGREADEAGGASDESMGCLRAADGGVLLIDEIARLPLGLQAKLLRVIETDEFSPIDSRRVYHADVRIVAATTHHLPQAVNAGHFSGDLYRRLSAVMLKIPPLRDQHNAIGAFCAYFITQYDRLLDRNVRYLSRRALRALTSYDWPGNVRELSHAIRDAVMQTRGDRIDLAQLPEYVTERPPAQVRPGARSTPPPEPVTETGPAPARVTPSQASARGESDSAETPTLDEVIKHTLVRSLRQTAGNRRRTANLLGISRSTLYRMLARYGIDTVGRVERKRGAPTSARPS